MLSNSRGPDTLTDLVTELGERAQAGTVEEAAEFGELVVVAIPFKDCRTVPPGAVQGKVVVDAMNYYPRRAAFNAIAWDSLRDKGQPSEELAARVA